MQYILSQQEFDNLVGRESLKDRDNALEVARNIIVESVKIKCGANSCSTCPISHIGHGGFTSITKEISRLICRKDRTYSK